MRTFLAAFLAAALVSVVCTPLVRRFALEVGAVSHPGGRHVHIRAMPRLGGVAICASFFAPLITLFVVESSVAEVMTAQAAKVFALLIGGVVMCIVGVVDDTRGLRAIYKLYAQIAVACLAFACGFRIEVVSIPLLGEIAFGPAALPVTIVWIVGITNAVNLIDGLDGLAAGVVFFAGITNLVIAYISGGQFVTLIMASMLGAVLGFLFYNFNPARIFMGDSGSYLLGFILGTTFAGGTQKASTAVSLLVPILALGIPIFDTLFSMTRRFLERRSIFSPDRGHIHHRLIDMGITHRRAVLIIYGVSLVFTVAAIAVSLGRSWEIGVALVLASAVLIGLVRFVGYFEYLHAAFRQKKRLRTQDTERLRALVPMVPSLFGAAMTERELLGALEQFAERADISRIDIFEKRGGVSSAYEWCAPHSLGKIRVPSTASYMLGADTVARADVKFEFGMDVEDLSPQADILMQVVVDVLASNLTRVKSRLAPESLPDANRPRESFALIGEHQVVPELSAPPPV